MKGTMHALLVIALFVLLMALWAYNPGPAITPAMTATLVLMVALGLALIGRLELHK